MSEPDQWPDESLTDSLERGRAMIDACAGTTTAEIEALGEGGVKQLLRATKEIVWPGDNEKRYWAEAAIARDILERVEAAGQGGE